VFDYSYPYIILCTQRGCYNLKLAKVQLKHNYIFISYGWVDHIAVYNYMFQPLSAIVRLYYFLL